MTNNEILRADLLDILFEHRNKSYGAYALRRYYNKRLLLALGIALTIVALLFLVSLFNGNGQGTTSRNLGDIPGLKILEIEPVPPPKVEEPPLPKKIDPPAQVKNLTILIVPDIKAVDVIPEQKEIAGKAISDINADGPVPTDLGRAISNVVPATTGNTEAKQAEQTMEPVEIQPSFPGGPEALALFFSRTLSSPTDLEPGEKKLVLVRFEVGADGSITKAEIVQSGGDTHDREVLRAFKRMPKWNPAIQNGRKVSASFTQPVTFIGTEQ